MLRFFSIAILMAGSIYLGWLGYTLYKGDNYLSEGIINFCAGMLVAFIFYVMIQTFVSSEAQKYEDSQRKYQVSIGLYNKFHSPEMIDLRCRVDRIMQRLKAQGLLEPGHRFYNDWFMTVDPVGKPESWFRENPDWQEKNKDWIALSTILHFYENMARLIDAKETDEKLLKGWFKYYFDDILKNEHFIEYLKGHGESVYWDNGKGPWARLVKVFEIDLEAPVDRSLPYK